METPVVFVACSNNQDDFLRELSGEMNDISNSLDEFDFHRIIKFVQPPYDANSGVLYDKISRIGDRLTVFHYSGHASGHSFRTEDEDYSKDQLLALLSGKKPNLVFLNGCATYGYVDFLLAAGVKAVIATTTAVNDGKARRFSAKFYESLARNNSLLIAFNEAKSLFPNAGDIKDNSRSQLSWGNLTRSQKKEPCPWGLYFSDELEDYNSRQERISIRDWVLISTAKDTLKLPPGSQIQYQHIADLYRLREDRMKKFKGLTVVSKVLNAIPIHERDAEIREQIEIIIEDRKTTEQAIDELTKSIEEKRLTFRQRVRQAEESETATRLLPVVSTLNYTEPRRAVSEWLEQSRPEQSLLFMLQGTKLCGVPLLQERILDTIGFHFRSEESCLRCTIECNSSFQTPITENTLWQKLQMDRKVGGTDRSDSVSTIFKQLNSSEIEPRNFLLVIKDALFCADIGYVLNFWEDFRRKLESQPGWTEWTVTHKKRVILIVWYEALPSEEGEWELAAAQQRMKKLITVPVSLCVVPQIEPVLETEIVGWKRTVPEFARIKTTPFANKSNRMLSVLENIANQLECPELYRLIENQINAY